MVKISKRFLIVQICSMTSGKAISAEIPRSEPKYHPYLARYRPSKLAENGQNIEEKVVAVVVVIIIIIIITVIHFISIKSNCHYLEYDIFVGLEESKDTLKFKSVEGGVKEISRKSSEHTAEKNHPS